MAAGASYTQNENVVLPLTYAGPRYLIFVANAGYTQPESDQADDTNNVYVLPIDVSTAQLSTTIVAAPATAAVGQTATVSWTVTNIGSGPADEAWSDGIYLSTTNTFGASATFLKSVPAGSDSPLAAGASYTHTAHVTFTPGQVSSGTYYLFVVADYRQQQLQIDRSQDAASQAVTITAPDLAIQSPVAAPSSATFGAPVTVSWTVTNTGSGAADEAWSDGVYFSTENTLDSSATFLASVPAGSGSPLAAGASYTHAAQVTLPLSETSAAGTYYILVEANYQGSQPVTDTTSTTSASPPMTVTLPPLPEIDVSQVFGPANAFNDSQVVLSWTDTNNGTAAAAGPWQDNLYYSTSPTGSNPVSLGSYTFPNSLAVGQSVHLATAVTLPAATGTFYFLVTADTDQAVNEGPNFSHPGTTGVAANPINVTQEPLPDLVVTSITPAVPASSSPGARCRSAS